MNFSKSTAGLIGLGTLVVGVILALVIFSGRGPAPASASPAPRIPSGKASASAGRSGAEAAQSDYLRALLKYKADQNWGELGVLAFNEAERVSAADRAGTLELLAKHQSSGGFPALFCIARHHWFGGDKDEACRWFIKASVVYSIDAKRCTDATARQAVPAVQSHFAPLSEHLKQIDRQTERQWTQEALDFENGLADREPARWMAAHGLSAFRSKGAARVSTPNAFLPDAQWRAARERERASIAESLAK